jgi:glutathione peroxidase
MRAGLIWVLLLASPVSAECLKMFDHSVGKLHSGDTLDLCEMTSGKPVLVVNTASHCGFTPQFEGLQALHEQYEPQGLVVLGFPSDDFRQEANNEEKTAEVCYINFGVEFSMSKPVSVKGSAAHPLFVELAAQTRAPHWNFNKYLVSGDGEVTHFPSQVAPDSQELILKIEQALADKAG